MFTIGTAAYKLYSASSQVGSTLSTLSNYHRYVTEAIFNSPSEVENLHPLVKQNLDRLARRIQVLSSPLNYCLLWSQHRGSAVAETIHQSKEVLKQTYHWLHDCNKDKSKLSDKEYMLKKLDEHIREIDFCLQALNLALSIIQTTKTTTNHDNKHIRISPSCLLSASNRIMAMHNSGGDVSICFGQLFKKNMINKNKNNWQRIYRRCALKIYRNGLRKSYELRIECTEYGFDSDDDIPYNLNESHPLTMKFDLHSSIYFTTLSSLIIDLPNYKKIYNNNINLNVNELIEDAFGWVNMLANQVQQQYIFVLKSGLDDWDKPLSSASASASDIDAENVIFLPNEHDNENNLTESMVSLDSAVIETRKRTHLASLLAPGGDYDETHVTPQLMAYMTRLAIYENDYTKPHTIYHSNSTFKKYNNNNLKMNDTDNNGVIISNDAAGSGIHNDEYKIKQQEKIPAHLHASDEELYLFLRNPPTPPVPFYPKNIHFTHRKSHRKSPHKSNVKKKAYFASNNKKDGNLSLSKSAIKDVTNSSLDMNVTGLQTLNALNSPKNQINEVEDADDMLHANFANLSIDN